MPKSPVFRFAPTPNGYLHLGHALSALLNFDMARKAGGHMLLRIEDIDATRCKPEFEQAIYEDLEWLGIEWEKPVRRQSGHLNEYRAALENLEREGLAYPAFESRAEIARMVADRERTSGAKWPDDPDGAPLYPGKPGQLATDQAANRRMSEQFALRLDMAKARSIANADLCWIETGGSRSNNIEAHPERWGDVILGRKETPTSYHLSVVLDDALQGVTHVVRGMDLYESTSIHRLLQEILGLSAPQYHHHRLILDADGKKLAKRDPSTTLRDLRSKGWNAADVRRAVELEL